MAWLVKSIRRRNNADTAARDLDCRPDYAVVLAGVMVAASRRFTPTPIARDNRLQY